MKLKIYYRKNLKLSPQKLAAVCTHIGKELGKVCGYTYAWEDKVVILTASDKKFEEYKDNCRNNSGVLYHIHIDRGFTEVEPNTECAIGWIEEDE
jgi:peptidyl-tRNA hydrolase